MFTTENLEDGTTVVIELPCQAQVDQDPVLETGRKRAPARLPTASVEQQTGRILEAL